MDLTGKFGTAINCIDGRVQVPVADWVRLHSQVQHVDMITEPGADKILSGNDLDKIDSIYEKVNLSIEFHQSSIIAVAGHFGCVANRVDFEERKYQIQDAVSVINNWNLRLRIVGLYVNEWNSVDLICDTEDEFKPLNSFL